MLFRSNQTFANVHNAMFDAMPKAKAALGDDYPVCGGDGFHPGPNGQLLMAYAFLKALGVDGEIGTITVDAKGMTTATDGHKVLSSGAGKAELESTRWPFFSPVKNTRLPATTRLPTFGETSTSPPSGTATVPIVVPSVTQRPRPVTPSSAAKNTLPATCVRRTG